MRESGSTEALDEDRIKRCRVTVHESRQQAAHEPRQGEAGSTQPFPHMRCPALPPGRGAEHFRCTASLCECRRQGACHRRGESGRESRRLTGAEAAPVIEPTHDEHPARRSRPCALETHAPGGGLHTRPGLATRARRGEWLRIAVQHDLEFDGCPLCGQGSQFAVVDDMDPKGEETAQQGNDGCGQTQHSNKATRRTARGAPAGTHEAGGANGADDRCGRGQQRRNDDPANGCRDGKADVERCGVGLGSCVHRTTTSGCRSANLASPTPVTDFN